MIRRLVVDVVARISSTQYISIYRKHPAVMIIMPILQPSWAIGTENDRRRMTDELLKYVRDCHIVFCEVRTLITVSRTYNTTELGHFLKSLHIQVQIVKFRGVETNPQA